MMKRTMLAALAVAVTSLFWVAPADAQDFPDYRFDIGINVGGTGFTSMLDDDHLGADTDDVRFEAGWLTGAQVTGWITQRIGLRGNMTFTERPINQGDFFDTGDEHNLAEDINLWTFSGDLLFRFARLGLFGAETQPFLALGLGIAHTNPAGDQPIAGELEGRTFFTNAGQPFVVAEEENELMGLVALGTDLRLADHFGLRFEIGDRIHDSPLRGHPEVFANQDEDVGNVIHQPYAQIGAHLLLGLASPEVVAVEPQPPAPPPAPEPEPEPVEEEIRVCVIDPDAEGGIRTVNAIYLPETRDTMVVVNGTRRALSAEVPRVTVANEADWFVRGEPLTVNLDRDATIEYTTWQSARMIEADRLTYMGTTRGLPVYASTDDVRDMRTQWEAARAAAAGDELDAIIAEDAELAAQLEEVQFLYVPLRPTGCVFQTVRVVEQVRKK